jgi:hypothetical protein
VPRILIALFIASMAKANTTSAALPDMQLGSDQLIDFLKAELETLETGLGGPDAEARGLLDMLQRQTRLIQQMSEEEGVGGSAAALTDLEIAQQIDRCAQLNSVSVQQLPN